MVADAIAFFSDWLHCRRAAVVLTRKGSPNGQDRSEVLASSCARAYNTLHGPSAFVLLDQEQFIGQPRRFWQARATGSRRGSRTRPVVSRIVATQQKEALPQVRVQ